MQSYLFGCCLIFLIDMQMRPLHRFSFHRKYIHKTSARTYTLIPKYNAIRRKKWCLTQQKTSIIFTRTLIDDALSLGNSLSHFRYDEEDAANTNGGKTKQICIEQLFVCAKHFHLTIFFTVFHNPIRNTQKKMKKIQLMIYPFCLNIHFWHSPNEKQKTIFFRFARLLRIDGFRVKKYRE